MITPFSDYVVIKILEHGETAGGIILPETMEESVIRGKVMSVGPGKWESGAQQEIKDIEKGDVVYMVGGPHFGAPLPFMVDGEEYAAVRYTFLIGKEAGGRPDGSGDH